MNKFVGMLHKLIFGEDKFMTIKKCCRCGGTHKRLKVYVFSEKEKSKIFGPPYPAYYTHCPVMGEVIFILEEVSNE